MPLKKTLASSAMICAFIAYAAYEHVHSDNAGLITLVMNDLTGVQTASGAPVQPVAQDTTFSSATAVQPQQPATPSAPQQTIQTQPSVQTYGDDGGYGGEGRRRTRAVSPAQPQTPPPQPQQQQTPAPVAQTQSQPQGQYKDGSYTGPSVNVYYGNVQVKATISGGQLTDVQFLQYPSDRQTSQYINSQAMPMLTQEAIQVQSANVSGVSGASATSQGFIQSLSSALAQAHV
jgi:uncharacterized protein with FMN-binding domain